MVKIHYRGSYSGDPASLVPGAEHPTAVAFKEPKTLTGFALVGNGIGVIIALGFFTLFYFLYGWAEIGSWQCLLGLFLSLVAAIPHEYLHAVCFPHDAYIYTNLKRGLLFAYSPDPIGKFRFIFMSILPTLVFGVIPLVFGLLFSSILLATMGAAGFAAASGDFLNIANALFQVPHGALVFMKGEHSYWYWERDEKKAAETLPH